jgi:hypothetical protein
MEGFGKQKDIDGDVQNSKGHFRLFVKLDDWFYRFTLTSRFFKSFFQEEIGGILDFHWQYCNACSYISSLQKSNPQFWDMIEKYKTTKEVIERRYIFLLNKKKLWLNKESIIRLDKINKKDNALIGGYLKNKLFHFIEYWCLDIYDKYVIAAHIMANRKENVSKEISSIYDNLLYEVYKKRKQIWPDK